MAYKTEASNRVLQRVVYYIKTKHTQTEACDPDDLTKKMCPIRLILGNVYEPSLAQPDFHLLFTCYYMLGVVINVTSDLSEYRYKSFVCFKILVEMHMPQSRV